MPISAARLAHPSLFLLNLTAAALAAMLWAAPSRAADGHDAPAAPAKAAAKAVVKPGAHVPAAADPMESLREKLATKLGAAKVPESPSPYVVRVVSKAGEAGHGDAGGAGTPAKVARLRAAKAAAGHLPDAHAAHWGYAGAGAPEKWGQLKPEFAACGTGTRQSPIDIRSGVKVDLEPIQFDYQASSFRVVDNGHTIQVNVGTGNAIEVQGRRYDLVQFHFHRPSEERVDGRQFDMVAHLVHKDAEGRLAVVAVLLDRGSVHPLVRTVWSNLPLDKGEEVVARPQLDISDLLPADRRYFTYMGSLTTPPCSEGVLWMVLQQPVSISVDQINVFSRIYPMNARPVQSASGRLIKQSN